MDRYHEELPICRERRSREIAGGEEFPKGSVELEPHEGRFGQIILDRVENGPVVVVHVEGDEVPCTIVPWTATCGDGRVWVRPAEGK